jgi:hypothetical protein
MPEETTDVQRSPDADALRAVYGREGCPICLVVLHTWQLAQPHNAFRLGLIYNEVLTDVLQELGADSGKHSSADVHAPKRGWIWNGRWRKRRRQADVRPAFEVCPFCQSRASAQERLISTAIPVSGEGTSGRETRSR